MWNNKDATYQNEPLSTLRTSGPALLTASAGLNGGTAAARLGALAILLAHVVRTEVSAAAQKAEVKRAPYTYLRLGEVVKREVCFLRPKSGPEMADFCGQTPKINHFRTGFRACKQKLPGTFAWDR